ncbi:hypothetical protein V3C99_004088 [Haemonchus contortus]
MRFGVLLLVCLFVREAQAILFFPSLLPALDQKWRSQRLRFPEYHWSGLCVEGHSQSPIDLVLGNAEITYNEELEFHNYQNSGTVIVDNRGHSGHIKGFLTWDEPPYFTGGGTNSSGKYFLRQLHFHWNSEHTFNGLRYPLELHLVHFREGFKPNSYDIPSSISVVAVPFLIVEERLAGIDDLLTAINSFGAIEPVTSFNPSVLLPNDRITYYKYTGSLTTPPCSEDVTWYVFPEPKLISAKQVEHLIGHHDRPFVGSARPVQHMNGRKLYLNKSRRGFSNAESVLKVLAIVLMCTGMMLVSLFMVMWAMRQKASRVAPSDVVSPSAPPYQSEVQQRRY